MLKALVVHFGSGTPLPGDELAEAQKLVHNMRGGNDTGAGTERLCELAVHWVLRNLNPVVLPLPEYRR